MEQNIFEEIKHINEYGNEFWKAREFYKILEYTEFGKFKPVIEKAKKACENSSESVEDHISQVRDMIKIATGTVKEAKREVDDYHLSRYACYLIIQNADPRKEVVALGQTYFAIHTRKQEISE